MSGLCILCGNVLADSTCDRCECMLEDDELFEVETEGLEDDEEIKALEKAAFGDHEDVWIEIDGHQQRVLGDPNMSPETAKALGELIKAAARAVANGDFEDDEITD